MTNNPKKQIAIIGTVGLPAAYSGFETLVENLVSFHAASDRAGEITVFCSKSRYQTHPPDYLGAKLVYLSLDANGPSSILYDILSMFLAIWRRNDVLLVLGVSGAIALPFVRAISSAKIVTNIDGVEWKREKWRGIAKWILRVSEWFAVKFSHEVVADNEGIVEHVRTTYRSDARKIAYGGDHALSGEAVAYNGPELPKRYALALCRIEPENNVAVIVEAFAGNSPLPLVFIGNWNNSSFGQSVRERFANVPGLHLMDPIYDIATLKHIRQNADLYVHGHSAGGTNPSLVEIMHFGLPILAYDCNFNRYTTQDAAIYFKNADDIVRMINVWDNDNGNRIGAAMQEIAAEHYVWEKIAGQYFDLIYQ